MQCHYCKWRMPQGAKIHPGDKHEPGCPYEGTDAHFSSFTTSYKTSPEKRKAYERGWNAGRTHEPAQETTNKSYMMGYYHGEAAAEEAFNSSRY